MRKFVGLSTSGDGLSTSTQCLSTAGTSLPTPDESLSTPGTSLSTFHHKNTKTQAKHKVFCTANLLTCPNASTKEAKRQENLLPLHPRAQIPHNFPIRSRWNMMRILWKIPRVNLFPMRIQCIFQ